MAASSVPNRASERPVLRNYQWFWNATFYSESVLDEQWQKYTDVENKLIEDAYNRHQLEVELGNGRIINLRYLVQYKKCDEFEQYPINRVLLGRAQGNVRLREERFSTEIPLFILPSNSNVDRTSVLFFMRHSSNISDIYRITETSTAGKSKVDILEEAIEGIIKAGSILGKEDQARSLAVEIENIKHYAIGMTPYQMIPSEIGEILAFLYTKETFWYKLINQVLRDINKIETEQVQTIGPFCYLLHTYLKGKDETLDCSVVYRGMSLTDDQRRKFMKPSICFSAFSSTSKNRALAEIYGNTLLIIHLDAKDMHRSHGRTHCASNIASISNFPEEEEVLIWPGSMFDFVKCEYDESNNKYILYLKQQDSRLKHFA